ncbi:MAG TPA: trehalose-6-phosphate synthase, partial [Thermomicrobiales bacterium]|nr:trehalose-6-phosphate synthase [Thermomicrobiales bacterium]
GLFRIARIGLVTPLRDGMNLVAKEFVAAQDPTDPGVLILSRFAGAAEELTEALLVNPYDPDEIADQILALLDDPAARVDLRTRGLARASGYSWRIAAERTRRVYAQAEADRG